MISCVSTARVTAHIGGMVLEKEAASACVVVDYDKGLIGSPDQRRDAGKRRSSCSEAAKPNARVSRSRRRAGSVTAAATAPFKRVDSITMPFDSHSLPAPRMTTPKRSQTAPAGAPAFRRKGSITMPLDSDSAIIKPTTKPGARTKPHRSHSSVDPRAHCLSMLSDDHLSLRQRRNSSKSPKRNSLLKMAGSLLSKKSTKQDANLLARAEWQRKAGVHASGEFEGSGSFAL